MTRDNFLNELRRYLSQLPPSEIEKHLAYYIEMLDDMMEDGLSEEEAVARMGSPKNIADQILQEVPLPLLVQTRVKPKSGWTGINILLLILGSPLWFSLLLAIIAVVFSAFVTIGALILAIFAVVLAIAIAGIVLTLSPLFLVSLPFAMGLLLFGAGLLCSGFSILCFFGAIGAAKALLWLTKAIVRWIKTGFIRKEREL